MAPFQKGQSGNPNGRPKKADKYAEQIGTLDDLIAQSLEARFEALDLLARGGFEQIQETWEPAGLIYIIKYVETKEGSLRVSELAFPELPPEQLVCIRRSRSIAAPDRKANEYLINRIAGTPVQQIEGSFEQQTTLPPALEALISKAYGTSDAPGEA